MTTAATRQQHDTTPAAVLSVAFIRREKTWKLGCTTEHGSNRVSAQSHVHQVRVLQAVTQAKSAVVCLRPPRG
jgi:hypothetical protein